MFTQYTYDDWLAAPEDKRELIGQVVNAYKASPEFKHALTAQHYFDTENEKIKEKYVVQLGAYEHKAAVLDDDGNPLHDGNGKPIYETKTVKSETKVAGTRLSSGFFFRLVVQQNQYLLANGVTLKDAELKKKLGRAFDTALSSIGEKALVDGVCWGFWNKDHLEVIRAVKDYSSGAVALLSEVDSVPRVLIQFWRISSGKPLYVRTFEPEGVTLYKSGEDGKLIVEHPRMPYLVTTTRDAAGVVSSSGSNYRGSLPVVPLYANPERRSELTEAIKSKIDCFDRIASDFGDNLQMANDIYWVLNNFGGSSKEILATLAQIRELKAIANISDGTGGGSTAEPHTFEVPYAARQIALGILKDEIYFDFMGLDTNSITGGSLTNVAIRAASTDLNLKCDRYEWQAFDFVQGVLRIQGVETEDISFTRRSLENETETIENIYRAAEDLDRETRLRKNPMVSQDEIQKIMANKAVEEVTGLPTMDQLKAELEKARNNPSASKEDDVDDGAGQG